jgi:cytochrome c biogenesis protein
MSHVARPGVRSVSTDLLDDLDGTGVAISTGDLFERLWHLFISMRTGLALILGLALLTLVGTVVAQVPAGMAADPEAYAAWLDGVRPKYGGWTNVLEALGLFSVFASIWFKSLVVLLSTSILACSVNRAPRLWKQAVHPRMVMSPGFYQHAALQAVMDVPAQPGPAGEALQRELRANRYRTVIQASADGLDLYADRFRWGPFGTVFAHLSIVLILAGAMLGAGGFRDEQFVAPVGSTVDVGYGTGLALQATSFTDSYYESGAPADYAANLVLYKDGQPVVEQTVRVNQPLRYGDVSFYQSFFGPAADLRIADAGGQTVFERGVALRWTTSDQSKSVGQVELPDQQLTVYVVGVASGKVDPTIKPGQVQLEVYAAGSNTPLGIEVVSPGQPVAIGSHTFTFLRERQFTGLIVARDPGVPFVWAGALLLCLGVALVFFFPNRRIWARIRPADGGSRIEAGAVTRHDVMFESAFGRLMDDVQLGLARPQG